LRAVLASLGDRTLAVGGLSDHLDVLLGVEQRVKARPHQRLVIDELDGDHRRSSPPSGSPAGTTRGSGGAALIGSQARTRQPPPLTGPASRVPPRAAARSRLPRPPVARGF